MGREGVKAIDAGTRTETTIGDQTASDGSIIIGAINVGGMSWLVALLAFLLFLVWRGRRQATSLVDIWVERNEKRFEGMTKGFVAWTKSSITVSAKEKRAHRLLRKRVKAVRRRKRKEAGRDKKIRDEDGNVIGQWDIVNPKEN